MKKEENSPHKIELLTDAHRVFGLHKPKHPLVLTTGANIPGSRQHKDWLLERFGWV